MIYFLIKRLYHLIEKKVLYNNVVRRIMVEPYVGLL